jgi:ribosomal protein L11 methylase PrmA
MRRALRPHGVAVLCGLLDHQARELAATYLTLGFGLVARAHRAGWSVLVLARAADRCTKARGRS